MKISHELPLSLLKYGYEWNDVDYCLPNFLKYEDYKSYFIHARIDNRFIILDNGLFEGVHYSNSELIDLIELIQPDIFIVPDEWNDSFATLRNAKSWMNNYYIKHFLPERTNIMAVCQGKDLHELMMCYQTLIDLGYKYIAFNHSSEAYQKMFPEYDKLKAQKYGRIEFIKKLAENNILKESVYHHLLGASDWREFQVYKNFKYINSCDTSAPIINGAIGIRFNPELPYNKPKEILEDIMEKNLEGQKEDIIFNVSLFKQLLK